VIRSQGNGHARASSVNRIGEIDSMIGNLAQAH